MNPALRSFLTGFVLPVAVSLVAITAFVTWFDPWPRGPSEDQIEWIRDAARLIEDRYAAPVSTEQLVFDAIHGMAAARDGYSEFVDPDDLATWQEQNAGHYVGFGFLYVPDAPPLTVRYAFPGWPAEAAGLEPGDRIVAVDGVDVTGMEIEEITERIKIAGGAGTAVALSVLPYGAAPGDTRDVALERAEVHVPTVTGAEILDPERGIGYVRLQAFHENSAVELAAAIDGLVARGLERLVLDLRRNRGGILDVAVAIAGQFIDDGVVLETRGRREDATTRVYRVDGKARHADLPLAVLVDEGSASAAEVVAGALQDHQRAVLVGDRTFGKGVVQSQFDLSYPVDGRTLPALLKLTTAWYFTPGGRCIERTVGMQEGLRGGLLPDVAVPIETDQEWRDLERFLNERDIPPHVWALLGERLGETPIEGFIDRQRRAAVDLLAGRKVFGALSEERL